MGISKKHKRKIIVDDSEYFWHIAEDYEVINLGTDKTLAVASEDKKFLIHYPINQNHKGENYIIIIGKVFGGNGSWGSTWQRIACPKWEIENKIVPSSVKKLIKWSLSEKDNVFVNYMGTKIE